MRSENTQSKILRSFVLIVVLLGAGGGIGYLLLTMHVEPPHREFAALPPFVETMIVHAEDVEEWFTGYGTTRPIRQANVAAEVAATVVERVGDIRAGSRVSRGQVLIRLDDRQYRYQLERALALAEAEAASLDELEAEARNLEKLIEAARQELRVARDEKTRVTKLFERGLAARKEYDFANLAYQQAKRVLQGYEGQFAKIAPRRERFLASRRGYEADAALARLNVERCEIKAPFSGHIRSVNVDKGDRVGPGTVVLTLVDSSRVEIPIQLPASVYNEVRLGAACRIESESLPGTAWHGEVARIAPTADERTRTFTAYVVVDNAKHQQLVQTTDGNALSGKVREGILAPADEGILAPADEGILAPASEEILAPASNATGTGAAGWLIPGMFVRAKVKGPTYVDGLLIPRGACRNGRVLVVEGSIARERSVTTERFIEDRALVSGQLDSGDRVILSHLDKLADGSPVRIHPERSAASIPQQSGKVREGILAPASASTARQSPASRNLESSP